MAHNHNKIILLLMCKNESKILERYLTSAIPHVDAVTILDTGSTDNTVELAENLLKTHGKPFKLSVKPFKNFGYNRTYSFLKAVELCKELGWDLQKTYTMTIDADMCIKVSGGFKDFALTANGYNVIQANGSIKYANTRFMRCGSSWKCIGSTHEYWSGEGIEKIPEDVFYIDDRNDGGCKADKFERDIRLLREEIAEKPNLDRAHYYLGQSLKDVGKFEEAIDIFKRRIELGGWYEEIHYSYYQIGKCYEALDRPIEMEMWMNKAFEYYPKKAEPLYHLVKYFREKSQHYKAYHYYLKGKDIPYPKDDVLFIENSVYEGLFDYEATILDCYVFSRSKQDGLQGIVSYINRGVPHNVDNVWDNMPFYVEALTSPTYHGIYSKFIFKDIEEFSVSSCCLIEYSCIDLASPSKDTRFLMNLRFVNYSINADGTYHIRSADGKVKTRNGYVFLDADYRVLFNVNMMEEDYKRVDSNIEGLEDVRLFRYNGEIQFTASCKNITDDGRIVIVNGKYDVELKKMYDVRVIDTEHKLFCEKNWIYAGAHLYTDTMTTKKSFIYNWHPQQISVISEASSNILIPHDQFKTPAFFSHCRGSSPFVIYDNKKWCVVHTVKYSTPRIYSHYVVQMTMGTMMIEQYSLPFCFRNSQIEYCLGFHIKNDVCCFIFSEYDCDPGMCLVPLANLRFIKC